MESTSVYRKIRTGTRPPAGCRTGKKNKAAQQPPGNDRSHFLRSCFTPVAAAPPGINDVHAAEKQFFRSVNHFTRLYGLPVPDVSEHIFPFNIHKAYTALQEDFKNSGTRLQLIIVSNNNTVCLATVREYDMGYHSLYYIPVAPLVRLLRERKRQHADLLLSVFSYLYKVQDIPFYADGSSYLYSCYECIENFVQESEPEYEDRDDYLSIITEFRYAEYWGNKILSTLRHPYTLQCLGGRIERFRPKDEKDKVLLEIAEKALALYEKYPARSILDEMPRRFMQPEKDDYDEERVIAADQILSFSWSDYGFHYDYLIEHINCDLQEMEHTDFPLALQLFDKPKKKERHDLSFCEQAFSLINALCDYLY